MVFYVKISEVVIKIRCPNDLFLYTQWVEFLTEKWVKFFLVSSQKEVDIVVNLVGPRGKNIEINKNPKFVLKLCKNKLFFDSLLGFDLFVACIRQMVINNLPEKRCLVLHASGFVKEEEAFLVIGNSGSGKSTLLKMLGGKYKYLGDDLVIVNKLNGELVAYPTPLNLKLSSDSYDIRERIIKGVLMVKKNRQLKVEKLNKMLALTNLIEQTRNYLNDIELAKLSFEYFSGLNSRVYKISYKLSDNVLDLIDSTNYENIHKK